MAVMWRVRNCKIVSVKRLSYSDSRDTVTRLGCIWGTWET